MISYRMRERLFKVFASLSMLLVLLVVLFPIYWMLLTGVKPSRELYLPQPTFWTQHPTLDHLFSLFRRTPYLIQLRNTALVAVIGTTVAITVASLGGYSLSRLRYKGRDFMASAIFFTYLVPGTLTLIPLYILFSRLGLLNSLYCLMLTTLAGGTPFAIWMLKGYFTGIPTELEDAALIDGCTRLQALRKVILPIAAPGIVACGVFAFTGAWNEYMMPMILNNKEELWTLAVGLAGLVYGDVFLWGEIMIGAFLMSIPVLILYMVGQRFVVTGLTAGAVKG
ncbi:MAG: hypothetical protein A2Y73_03665 [Chloroflexi bacterium RBG_13_56_8]|nr:MAG: hypothetical protein A2Y73_03665 [Chloroflexi bacterium RBG_13_56_8]